MFCLKATIVTSSRSIRLTCIVSGSLAETIVEKGRRKIIFYHILGFAAKVGHVPRVGNPHFLGFYLPGLASWVLTFGTDVHIQFLSFRGK